MAYNQGEFKNWNGRIFVKKDTDSTPLIEVDGEVPIKVREESRGDSKVYVVMYKPFSPPVVSLSASPSQLEIGQSSTINYSGKVTKGSEDIKTIVSSPVQTLTITGDDVTFSAIAGSNLIGSTGVHDLIATDMLNNEVKATASVAVRHRYFIGMVARNTTTFTEQESKLSTSMKGAYGTLTPYNIPIGEHHIAWLVPAGETMPTPTDSNGFPWEVVNGGTKIVTNAYGLDVSYTLIHTKNFYTGANTVNLKV